MAAVERLRRPATRVALTRPKGTNDELARRLRSAGIAPVECPLIEVVPLGGPPIPVVDYDWLVLTSRSGVDAFFARVQGSLPPVAVIGPGTAEALRGHGVEPTIVASTSTQEGLVAALPRPPGRVLFAGAEDARDVLVRELAAEFVPLYRTSRLRPDVLPEVELVVLASGSAAEAYADAGGSVSCVSIGPTTSAHARRRGLDVVAEAETHDLDGLVAAVRLAASRIASSPS